MPPISLMRKETPLSVFLASKKTRDAGMHSKKRALTDDEMGLKGSNDAVMGIETRWARSGRASSMNLHPKAGEEWNARGCRRRTGRAQKEDRLLERGVADAARRGTAAVQARPRPSRAADTLEPEIPREPSYRHRDLRNMFL